MNQVPPSRPAPRLPPPTPEELKLLQSRLKQARAKEDYQGFLEQLFGDKNDKVVSLWSKKARTERLSDETMWELIDWGSGKIPLMSTLVESAQSYFTNHDKEYINNLYVDTCIATLFVNYLKTLRIATMSKPLIFKLIELKSLMSRIDYNLNIEKQPKNVKFISEELLTVIIQIYFLITFDTFGDHTEFEKIRERFEADLTPVIKFSEKNGVEQTRQASGPNTWKTVTDVVANGVQVASDTLENMAPSWRGFQGYNGGNRRTRKRSKRSRKRKQSNGSRKRKQTRFTKKL
jgi:hypothetical protein